MTEAIANISQDELPPECVAGASFFIVYGMAHPSNALLHVRAIVDGRAVCKRWIKHKRRWEYSVQDAVFFHVHREIILWRRPSK